MDVNVTADTVGSYFVSNYYKLLHSQPDRVHKFYTNNSTMMRVDGDSTETASNLQQIKALIKSLNFVTIEIESVNSLDSWEEGVHVMVSGIAKIKDINRKREFVQTFFLAPQKTGYFVLNDIFQFIDDTASEKIDSQPQTSTSLAELAGDPVDKNSLQEQQQLDQDFETKDVVEETPAEETAPQLILPIQSVAHIDTMDETASAFENEPSKEEKSPKKSYASIVGTPRGQSSVARPGVQQSSSSSTPADAAEDDHGLAGEVRGRGRTSNPTGSPRGRSGGRKTRRRKS